ncbi:helix-turn-helix domain-containing protein [Adhaeribacter aquaticus]|uniref:helix-turn-helix domain-containing protein n=1 Tax=Adhaeribacter aquaticus TaxID=299567 RepID=UPI0004024E7E|nr:AraC family transcriptional regulator [Adhaeribacter aquaticus]
MAYSVAVYLATISRVALEAKDAIANSFYFNPVKEVEDYLSVVSAVIYWMAGSRLVLQYRRWLYANISQTDYPTYAWLRNIMLLMGVLIIGLTVAVTLDYLFHFGALYFIHWQIFFVYMAMLVYYLGFKGAQIPDKKFAFIQIGDESEKKPEPFFQEIDGGQEVGLQETTIASISQTEEELKLSEEKKQQVKEAIRKALETDEMYLDPELNLQKLAKAVQTSPAIVSAVINNSFQKSFRNLINEYRVEKVKQRLTEPASNQFSILGIAYECGFNSEASFYRIFKATVGISPKEYINQFRSLQ